MSAATIKEAAWTTSAKEGLAKFLQAREEALACVPEYLQQKAWQMQFSIVSESKRWEILYYDHNYEPSLYAMWKACLVVETAQTMLSVYDIKRNAEPDLRLGKAREGMQGHK